MQQSLKIKLPTLEEVVREQARRKYINYVEYVHHGKWKAGKHHVLICDKLEEVIAGKLKRLMIWIPPRHGKSMSVTKTFPSFYLGKFPDNRVLEVSYGVDLAKEFGEANRKKVEEFGSPLFGIEVSKTEASKVSWNIEGRDGGMVSVGVGGGITGKGADLLILDDPIKNRQEAESEAYRRFLYNEWQSSIYTRLHPDASVIIILTRWHEDDLAGRLLREKSDTQWEVLSLPCICNSEFDLLGRKIGEPLWPEHGFDKKWASKTKKDVGSYVWASLYQQEPSPAGGSIIKRDWIKYYNVMPTEFDILVQSWDCAFKSKEESDFVSGQVWGRKGANFYLLDRVHDKMGITDTMNSIINLRNKWPNATSIFIEDKANGTAVIEMLKKKISGIIPVEPLGGKVVRTQAVAPYFEAGNVFLPQDAEWISDYVEELVKFPNARHDDDVDSMSQAITNMSHVYNAKVYPSFTTARHVDNLNEFKDVVEIVVGVVPLQNKCSVTTIVGFSKKYAKALVLDSLFYDHETNNNFDLLNYLKLVNDFLKVSVEKYKAQFTLLIDDEVRKTIKSVERNKAYSTIAGMRKRTIYSDKEQLEKISLTNLLIANDRLIINNSLNEVVDAFKNTEYDDRSVDSSDLLRNNTNKTYACLASIENCLYRYKRYLL